MSPQLTHPQVVCALDEALETSSRQSWRSSSAEVQIPRSVSSLLAPTFPTSRSLPNGDPLSILPSLSKIEALHGSYLAIALPPSAGKYHDHFSTGNGSPEAGSPRIGFHPSATSPAEATAARAPAPAQTKDWKISGATVGVGDKLCGHADAAATTALAMERRAGEIELPGGGRTRVRVGLCSGAVCCAVIGVDRPRFR